MLHLGQHEDRIEVYYEKYYCVLCVMIEKDIVFLLKDSNKGLFEYMLSSAFERLKELNFHANNVYMGCQEAKWLKGIQ